MIFDFFGVKNLDSRCRQNGLNQKSIPIKSYQVSCWARQIKEARRLSKFEQSRIRTPDIFPQIVEKLKSLAYFYNFDALLNASLWAFEHLSNSKQLSKSKQLK